MLWVHHTFNYVASIIERNIGLQYLDFRLPLTALAEFSRVALGAVTRESGELVCTYAVILTRGTQTLVNL